MVIRKDIDFLIILCYNGKVLAQRSLQTMKFPKILDTDAEIAQKYNGKIKPAATIGEVRAMIAGLAVAAATTAGIGIYNEITDSQRCEVIFDDPDSSIEEINSCY